MVTLRIERTSIMVMTLGIDNHADFESEGEYDKTLNDGNNVMT